jgi:hypothetical protein
MAVRKPLIVDGGRVVELAAGDTLDGYVLGSDSYSVSVNDVTFAEVTYRGAALIAGANVYRVRLSTQSTGTDTGACFLLDNPDTAGWRIWDVVRNGTSSNHPYLVLDAGVVKVRTDHTSLYTVRVIVEAFVFTGSSGALVTALGVDSTVYAVGSDLRFRRADSLTTNHRVWHDGNDGASSGLDSDLLDGQHGSFYQNAGNLNAGTLLAARMPALTGDVTTSAGAVATTIAVNVVSNTKLADMATQTFKGRTTAGTGDPEDLTIAQAKTMLNLTGTNSGDQTITLTSDVTGSGTGSFATTIAADVVGNTKLANMAVNTIKGRITAGTGDPEDLTGAQAATIIGCTTGLPNDNWRMYFMSTAAAGSAKLCKIRASSNADGAVDGVVHFAYDYGSTTVTHTLHFHFAQRTGTARGKWWYEHGDQALVADRVYLELIDVGSAGTDFEVWLTHSDFGQSVTEIFLGAGYASSAPAANGTLSTATKSTGTALFDTRNAPTSQLHAATFHSLVTTGTAPLTVASTTLVTNLNADLLDSQEGSYYLARANHTGTQTASTISDFNEAVDDRVGALLVAGTNITLNYNDAANTLTITAASGGGNADTLDGLDSTAFALIAGSTFTGAIGIATGSDSAPGLFVAGDTNTGLRGGADDTLRVITAGTERHRTDGSGRILIGTTSSRSVGLTHNIQFENSVNGVQNGISLLHLGDASVSGPQISFGKSRGGVTAPNSGDNLGVLRFYGADGTDFGSEGARIEVKVDGTPATGKVPARFSFQTTATGAFTPTERLSIDDAGNVVVSAAALSTSATDGFFYLPSMAGAPSGTPTSYSGRIPSVFDTTNNLLRVYDGSWLTIPTMASSLSSNGYANIGGLILQWGTFTNNLDTEQTVNFPIAFSSACWSVVVNRQVGGPSAPLTAISLTTTSFGVNRVDSIDGSETVNWFAVGM